MPIQEIGLQQDHTEYLINEAKKFGRQPKPVDTTASNRFIPNWSDPIYRSHVFEGMQRVGLAPEFPINPQDVISEAVRLNLISHLTPDQSTVLDLRYEHHLSQSEIAGILTRNSKMVSKIEQNGLHRLQRYITRRRFLDRAMEEGLFRELTQDQRDILRYRYYEGKSTFQTAQIIGHHRKNVSQIEGKALRKLEGLLSK